MNVPSPLLNLSYPQLASSEAELLADWLTSDSWPFHGQPMLGHESIRESFNAGLYNGKDSKSFWILLDEKERIGFIRLFDLLDPTPRFDLRLRTGFRGKGIGKRALRWLTDHVFGTMPTKIRIEATTRQDNVAMRRVFRSCGYAKEAHYRGAWPTQEGKTFDAVGYGITRSDWANKLITPVDWDDEQQ